MVGLLARRPDIQESAYRTICDIYGAQTWGHTNDENKVPYITALLKECLRYFTVLHLNLPRTAQRDISCKNIVIPKGTAVFFNAWARNRGDDF